MNVMTFCVENEFALVHTPGVTATPAECDADSPSSPTAVMVMPPPVVTPSARLVYPGGAVYADVPVDERSTTATRTAHPATDGVTDGDACVVPAEVSMRA